MSSPPEPLPCQCERPNADCQRSGHAMIGRLWELCRGVHCTREQSERYRQWWDGQARLTPCQHQGPATGDVRPCGSCPGRVALKVFFCLHPARPATTTAQECKLCPYWAALNSPANG
ncbi:MAG: hypothetical protein JNM56_15030 [Planctomycetia bacterium]|nr:hypothetical protein [Planctomycetia bacterium]